MSVQSVSLSPTHSFSKTPTSYIYLLPSYGVQGDAHSDTASSTSAAYNPREVHLLPSELLASLQTKFPTYDLSPGALGENITTTGVELQDLREGWRLHFSDGSEDGSGGAVVRITGSRVPWRRLDVWPEGVLDRIKAKSKNRKDHATVGVYGVVEREGYVQAGYGIYVEKVKGGKALKAV